MATFEHNVKEIYPGKLGYVTKVVSMQDALDEMYELGHLNGWAFESDEQALTNLLTNPTVTLTKDPIGEEVRPYETK
tara:strand:+ start:39892 stop:40122 length:231 start_codon:yes stop_codon:yes gene_type:complete